MSLLALGLMAALSLPAAMADDAPPPSFRDDVAPILVARCLGCHDEKDAQGGLNMSTFAKLREGGEIEGDLILLPGEPDESHLVRVIRPDATIRMPYKQDPLTRRGDRDDRTLGRRGGRVGRTFGRRTNRRPRRPARGSAGGRRHGGRGRPGRGRGVRDGRVEDRRGEGGRRPDPRPGIGGDRRDLRGRRGAGQRRGVLEGRSRGHRRGRPGLDVRRGRRAERRDGGEAARPARAPRRDPGGGPVARREDAGDGEL